MSAAFHSPAGPADAPSFPLVLSEGGSAAPLSADRAPLHGPDRDCGRRRRAVARPGRALDKKTLFRRVFRRNPELPCLPR